MHKYRGFLTLPLVALGLAGAVGAAAAAGGWALYTQHQELTARTAELEQTLASTTALLIASLEEAQSSFSDALEREKEALARELGDISGTVNTLEKLAKTDPELLQKYSKVFFLNEHYAPERTVAVPQEFVYDEGETERIDARIAQYLEDLLEEAQDDGIELYVKSAFRSYNEQSALKGAYAVTYGAGTANQFSADQGYSEHQLGTTVDFITTGLNGQLSGFDRTAAYEWLLENAHRFGFILSYPKGNQHYIFEPWHWRFVGEPLARELERTGKSFYELDQREIDEYLVLMFD
jgi:LAS superfamily LD-carboxypeptidase LdcB